MFIVFSFRVIHLLDTTQVFCTIGCEVDIKLIVFGLLPHK